MNNDYNIESHDSWAYDKSLDSYLASFPALRAFFDRSRIEQDPQALQIPLQNEGAGVYCASLTLRREVTPLPATNQSQSCGDFASRIVLVLQTLDTKSTVERNERDTSLAEMIIPLDPPAEWAAYYLRPDQPLTLMIHSSIQTTGFRDPRDQVRDTAVFTIKNGSDSMPIIINTKTQDSTLRLAPHRLYGVVQFHSLRETGPQYDCPTLNIEQAAQNIPNWDCEMSRHQHVPTMGCHYTSPYATLPCDQTSPMLWSPDAEVDLGRMVSSTGSLPGDSENATLADWSTVSLTQLDTRTAFEDDEPSQEPVVPVSSPDGSDCVLNPPGVADVEGAEDALQSEKETAARIAETVDDLLSGVLFAYTS